MAAEAALRHPLGDRDILLEGLGGTATEVREEGLEPSETVAGWSTKTEPAAIFGAKPVG
jgi:hypothetical protein